MPLRCIGFWPQAPFDHPPSCGSVAKASSLIPANPTQSSGLVSQSGSLTLISFRLRLTPYHVRTHRFVNTDSTWIRILRPSLFPQSM
jgi:hypothetical protein